jgi:hypothetical protein
LKESEGVMDLVNEYLRAVAALLPKAQREDIVAELRDTILTRIEAREADLGRPLTDDEIEAVLREVGHPVVVAARYREGPQHVIGPTLYPYWLFAVKAAIALQVVVAVVVVLIHTVAFGDFGVALGRAIGSSVTGTLVLIGAATCAAWFVERHGARIDYLDKWRVRDLRILEFAAWDLDTLRDWIGTWQTQPRRGPREHRDFRRDRGDRRPPPAAATASASATAQPFAPPPFMPPPPWDPALRSAARGLGFIALGTVLLLWWTGVLPVSVGLTVDDWASLDIAPGALAEVNWTSLRAMLFLPVLAYAAVLILQGAVMLAYPYAVRLRGLLEAARGSALLAFCAWIWTVSPLAPAVGVTSVAAFIRRMAMLAQTPPLPLEPIATLVVVSVACTAFALISRGLWDLVFGAPPAYVQAAPPPGVSHAAR